MIRLRKNVWTLVSVACLSALLFFLIQDAGAAARAGGNQGPTGPTAPTGPSQVSPPTGPPSGGVSGGVKSPNKNVVPRQGVATYDMTCVGPCARTRDLCLTKCGQGGVPGCSQRCYNYYNGCASKCALRIQQ
jgi:hypothetical protein